MILFEWTPPAHRRGLPPCCNSYYINITHLLSSESIVDDNITSPSIEFRISEDRLCDVLLVSIIATNVVGEGAEFKQRWSLGGKGERVCVCVCVCVSGGGRVKRLRRPKLDKLGDFMWMCCFDY